MSGNLSNYAVATLLDAAFGGVAPTLPVTYYLRLYSVAPGVDGTGGTELSGTGYAPKSFANNLTNWAATVARAKELAVQQTFATPGGSWGTAIAWALWDASSGGNMWAKGTTPSQSIGSGASVSFAAGDLDISISATDG